MDGFADNFDQPEVDPAAEFLAREQNELAGLDDDITPATASAPAPAVTNGDAPIENQLDSAETAEEDIPSPAHRPTPVREEAEKIKKWREEQKTRLEEKDANEEKKRIEWQEAAKKELEEWYRHHDDLIAKTRSANRNAEKQFVADDDEIEPGTEWERIAKHCDFNPKASKGSKDVSRMRSIILQLKQNPLPVNGFGNKRS